MSRKKTVFEAIDSKKKISAYIGTLPSQGTSLADLAVSGKAHPVSKAQIEAL